MFDSRARFDESKRYSGVFHQAGRPITDADLNEETRIRSTDAGRRSADLAEGSPDAGFQISDAHLLDANDSVTGWTGTAAPPADLRELRPQIVLDRREPAGLPHVVRARGHLALRRTLPGGAVDLVSMPAVVGGAPAYAAQAVVVTLRFEVPPNEQETPDVRLQLFNGAASATFPLGLTANLPSRWTTVRVPVAQIAAAGLGAIDGWGLTGLTARTTVWIDALLLRVAGLGRNDFVIRGGNGTLTGAGRLYGNGRRAFIPSDLRYAFQADYPDAPALLDLLPGGAPASGRAPEDGHYLVYADLWHDVVTSLFAEDLVEPALDGLDTTTRQRLITQVKVRWVPAGGADELPAPTGGGALTTTFADDDARPLRYPVPPEDPCRDRCLYTESMATGRGYRGTDNIHVRVEVMRVGERPVLLLARDNAATLLPLTQVAPAGALILRVPPAEAGKLAAGDLVVIEDHVTRKKPEGPRAPVLRRLRSVDAATGALELEPAGATAIANLDSPPVGGGLPVAFGPDGQAAVRRWEHADWIVPDVRYNLGDGLELAFAGPVERYRNADYWSFAARIAHPDGQARGVVDRLIAAPPHGPVHAYVPLARIHELPSAEREFEDVRPRFLPLVQVRDRLMELEAEDRRGTFKLVIGDGQTTFGDLDQNLAEGVSGDEALQDALRRIGDEGGTIFMRSGDYRFERPVILRGVRRVRIVGEGDGTRILSVGAGGAFVLDRSGASDGLVSLERLSILEDPSLPALIGAGAAGGAAVVPPPVEPPLTLTDLSIPGAPTPIDELGVRLRGLAIGEGRVMGSLIATIEALRRIQRENQGQPLENIPAAAPLLGALRRIPHGVITIADSQHVWVHDCSIRSVEPRALSSGVMITGTCREIEVAASRIEAATGVAAIPLSTFVSPVFLRLMPVAGLAITGLRVLGNQIRAAGDAVHGLNIADGTLEGVEIRDNLIDRYAIGLVLADRVELRGDRAVDRLRVSGNRVLGSRVAGIQVSGDGIDLDGNEVRNQGSDNLLASSGLFFAGIQVTGQGVRVHDSWIALPRTGNAPVLGVCAGIVVGDGMDDGDNSARDVFDVEISDNRIEGEGAASMAAGVLVGGPQPIVDLRIRANVIRQLGDAAVRVLGGTAAMGRVRVEDNRIESVALAELPTTDLDLLGQLRMLGVFTDAEAAAIDESTLNTPEALLDRLLPRNDDRARPGLDAALRWLERLTLRGGIVASRLEEGEILHNRIQEVGVGQPVLQRMLDGEVRTAGIAAVGGRDVVIDGNHIERVRAPLIEHVRAADGRLGPEPASYPALRTLALTGGAAGASAPQATSSSDLDLHAALTALHGRMVEYAFDATRRQTLGRTIYGALDAVVRALDARGGPSDDVVRNLEGLGNLMRSTQKAERHTEAAHQTRAVLAHLLRTTAPGQVAGGAWSAVEAVDGAVAARGADVSAVLAKLRGNASLFDDLTPEAAAPIRASLDGADAAGALRQLLSLALVRDEKSRKGSTVTDEVVGVRGAVITSLARTIEAQHSELAQVLTNEPANIDKRIQLLGTMRSTAKALTGSLREVGSELHVQLDTDFRALDRATTVPSADARLRFDETLKQVREVVSRKPTATVGQIDPAGFATLVRTAKLRGDDALRMLVVDHLDVQLGRVEGLAPLSDSLVDAGLGVLQSSVFQLHGLIEDDAELKPLGLATITAVRAATGVAGNERAAKLRTIRSQLRKLGSPARTRVEAADGATAPTSTTTPTGSASALTAARRAAGLGALVLTLRDFVRGAEEDAPAAGGPGPRRVDGLQLLESHLPRALEEAGQSATDRQSAADRLKAAMTIFRGNFSAGAASNEEQLRLAALGLMQVLDDAAANAEDHQALDEDEEPAQRASRTLLHAGALVLSGTASALDDTKSYLASRVADVSPVVVGTLNAARTLEDMVARLRRGMERLANGETPSELGRQLDRLPVAEPDPADGVFTAAVENRVRIAANELETALRGIVVRGATGHLLADPPATAAGPLFVDIAGNQVRGCALGALDVEPGSSSMTTVVANQALACGDMSAGGVRGSVGGVEVDAAVLAGPLAPGPAVVRVVGSGDLVLQGNLLSGNGHGREATLLHEVLADWRGNVVVRGNTLRHNGGGAGGVALLLITEDLADRGLVRRLSRLPALAVEPVTASVRPDVIRVPSRTFLFDAPTPIAQIRASHYALSAAVAPARSLLSFLVPRPIWQFPLVRVPQRRSIHVEGNQVIANGPALLLLADGRDVISASVVANELRSLRATGVAYLRHTDATVFTGNHCECTEAVNVVVLRPDAAPVSATGNVILGQQPVVQRDPLVLAKRASLKTMVKTEAIKSLLPEMEAAPVATAAPAATAAPFSLFSSASMILPFLPGLQKVLTPVKPPPPPPPDGRAHSLVIVGGTRVVAAGNTTSAGALTLDADRQSELNA